MFGLCYLLWCSIIYLSRAIDAREYEGEEVLKIDEDLRRPIWNIAHMVNALYQVDYYLDEGANSLEFDITFDWQGTAKYTFHGIPCDCFRSCTRYEYFETYLDYLRKLTTPGHEQYRKELVLLFMDLKLSGLTDEARDRAGEDLAMKLLDIYWKRGTSGANAYILISVPSVQHIKFINTFRRTLKSENFTEYESKIGFDFSGNEDLDSIRYTYESENINKHIWQGDGITNCLPRGTSRLRDALRRRDQPGITYVDKVYWWTADRMSTLRTTLRMGIDGMITNYPNRLAAVLNEVEFSSTLRLATLDDSPWVKYAYRTADLISDSFQSREGNITENFDEEELLYNC